jgi:putative transposase
MNSDGTHTCIFLEINFSVKNKSPALTERCRMQLNKLISQMINKSDQKLVSFICMPEEVYLYIRISPGTSLPDLMRSVKSRTSRMINVQKLVREKFKWENGYEAISVSPESIYESITQLQEISSYITSVEETESIQDVLRNNGISFDPDNCK